MKIDKIQVDIAIAYQYERSSPNCFFNNSIIALVFETSKWKHVPSAANLLNILPLPVLKNYTAIYDNT